MDIAPQEFSGKSLPERIGLLLRGGGVWMLIIASFAFFTAFYSLFVEYTSRNYQERAAIAQAAEMRITLAKITHQAQSMQDTAEEITKIASQIPDAQLRENILQKALLLQKQIFELVGGLYKTLETPRGPLKHSGNEPNKLPSLSSLSIISGASAQPATPQPPSAAGTRFTQEDARLYVMLSVVVVLGITFLTSVVAIFKATNPDVLKFAFDTVKTLMGFFIGVATAFLGLPAPH